MLYAKTIKIALCYMYTATHQQRTSYKLYI
jgi:hypothetical protein